MGHAKQFSFLKSAGVHRFAGGGVLRKQRIGRKQRPLSTREPLHLVFKANKEKLKTRSFRTARNYGLSHAIIKKYAKRFFIKIEQLSIQSNHMHLLIRTTRRSQFHFFFRVVAGQIAQRFEQEGFFAVTGTPTTGKDLMKPALPLWQYRPFSRVIRGWKSYRIVRDYIQLNEKEATGEIRYSKQRLRGLSTLEREVLWSYRLPTWFTPLGPFA